MQQPRSSQLAVVVTFVLAIPFLAGGIACLLGAYRRYGTQPRPADAGIMLAFGLILSAMAALLIGSALYRATTMRGLRELQRSYPGAPWMWRREWQHGRIADRSGKGLWFLWLFAILWLGGSVMFVFELARAGARGPLVVSGIAVLIGITIVYLAVMSSLRKRKFGRSTLVMTTYPAPIGGQLKGHIETTVQREDFANAKITVTLACVERIVRRGKNKGTVEHDLWSKDGRMSSSSITAGAAGAVIPVAFSIPDNLEASSVEDGTRTIVWRLRVDAEVRGLDYAAVFELPVFDRSEPAMPMVSASA